MISAKFNIPSILSHKIQEDRLIVQKDTNKLSNASTFYSPYKMMMSAAMACKWAMLSKIVPSFLQKNILPGAFEESYVVKAGQNLHP